jgi:hypothetical protein
VTSPCLPCATTRRPNQQRQFEAQEQAAAAEAADTYDPSYEVQLRRQGLPGHIKSVQVQNFMCHENFRMEFR